MIKLNPLGVETPINILVDETLLGEKSLVDTMEFVAYFKAKVKQPRVFLC